VGFVDRLARLLEAPLAPRSTSIDLRDAIVVLGAPLRRDRMTPIVAERVAAALALWRAGGAPRIVATGGVTSGSQRAEAEVMADALRAEGADVLVEARSRTTAENAAYTWALLGPARVWVVTQPFHARRATRLFADAGFDARAWHIADSLQYRDRRRALRWLVREYAAWARLLSTTRAR
jgi:uncharacterized SAM-binding protein YcdF (DUF218 family)